MLKDFTPRLYQQTILATAIKHNTLVVLPTGLGKTALALLLAVQRLRLYPDKKILLLAPTKPLCEQHVDTFRNHLAILEEEIVLFTGGVKPEKRAELWKTAKVVISTPQGLENDLINKRIELSNVSLLIFDEAHHATGEYAYVWLAEQYGKSSPFSKILGLTASPGSDMEIIREVCSNLLIEKVEVRTEKDADVLPYIQKIKKNWVKIPFPDEFKQIQKHLQNCCVSKLREVQQYGFCNDTLLQKGHLLGLQRELQRKMMQGEHSFELLRSVSLVAEALKVDHALELLETQGVRNLSLYLEKIQKEALTSKVKAVKRLVQDGHFKAAAYLTNELVEKGVSHPKVEKLLELVSAEKGKMIIFTQYRDSAEMIVKRLQEIGLSSHIFVGQAKKKGLGFSQKQQKEILDKFRVGEFQALVSTSVGEEGLDIPKVDTVIFFEPIPSAIRSIQRRGRTGRLEKGEVTILVTEGTRDEGYRWSAHHKEKRMYRNLEQLKKEFVVLPEEKITLDRFIPEKQAVTLLADHREKGNRIVKELLSMGVSVQTAQLSVGDYVFGNVGVELKKVHDFVQSIIDGRLLEQVRMLKQEYAKSVLIIEGDEDIYAVRNVHANAIRGMLASIVLGFGVPILYTKHPKDTAALLAVMVRREQDKSSSFSYHAGKPKGNEQQLEFIVSSFPNVGVVQARRLLQHFGSVKAIMNAAKDELMKVEGIGDKTAESLIGLFEMKYERE